MFNDLAADRAFLAAKQAYHRWREDFLKKPPPEKEIQIPRTDAGAPVPIIYGRCRVRAPILAWHQDPFYDTASISGTVVRRELRMGMFYVLGTGFPHGDGISGPIALNRLHTIYAGDHKGTAGHAGIIPLTPRALSDLTGNGGNENPVHAFGINDTDGESIALGDVEFLNGGPAQQLVNAGATTYTGSMMLNAGLTEAKIASYRDFMCVGLLENFKHGDNGGATSIPAYHAEASSYQTNHAQLGTYSRIGPNDSNPVNAIYDLMIRCGVSPSEIDMASFQAAQYTLHTEGHGYSRCIDSASDGESHIDAILRQIDASLYKDPYTRTWRLKLIRPDFNPNTIVHITKSNCWELQGYVAGNWADVPNAVSVLFEDRAKDYNDNTVEDKNQSLASAQRDPMIIEYRGTCNEAQARNLAARERSARSRPIAKCRAICDRTLLRLMPGDPVKVTMAGYNVSGGIFRVANVEHGTLEDGKIAIDLIQDHFFVWRNATPVHVEPPPVVPVPPVVVSGG